MATKRVKNTKNTPAKPAKKTLAKPAKKTPAKPAKKTPAKPAKKAPTKSAKKIAANRSPKPSRQAATRATAIEFKYAKSLKRLPGAKPAQLAAIEAHFGGPLPSDYADFLRSINGGAPNPSLVSSGFAIEAFYGAGSASAYYDVLKTSKDTSKTAARPIVAIAGDGSGDQLIFREPGDPAIYHWIHDEEAEPRRIAKSFDALLGSLTH